MVVWEAPAIRLLALYMFLSDERLTAGAVSARDIVAADRSYLMLQQLLLLLLPPPPSPPPLLPLLHAAAVGVAADRGGGPPVGTEAIEAGR